MSRLRAFQSGACDDTTYEHWPCALANEEVTLPMAALGSGVDLLGPFVDGDAILDGISRRSRSARAAAFVTAREITP
jgi:hypothetical protein